MMLRKMVVGALGALAMVAGMAPSEAAAAEILNFGTLAPKSSVWGKVFDTWATAIKTKSGGKLEIAFHYNGTQGDEGAMVGKMKAGQLDGAAITAVGLSKIYKPVLALQIPGALTSWDKVDKAQAALRPEFEKGISGAGFQLLGWGNIGRAHLFSKGGAIRTPDDLKSRKPYMWRDDIIAPVFYQIVGATPVPLNNPEVLPKLKSGAIDSLNTPSLAADQLQWAPELTHITEDATGVGVGALVLSENDRVKSLPADLRGMLTDTGKIAATALGAKIRAEDEAAYNRLKGRMTVVTWTADEKGKWAKVFKDTRARLAQGTFSPDLVKRVEGYGN